MLLRNGSELILPMFTSLDYFDLYRSRTKTPMVSLTLSTPAAVYGFLTEPPLPGNEPFPECTVLLDPIDDQPVAMRTFDFESFLNAFRP